MICVSRAQLALEVHFDDKILATYKLYLPSAMFPAQVLMGLRKQLKEVIRIEHNVVKNPNWLEAIQTSWLFTSLAKDLNSGLNNRETNGLVVVSQMYSYSCTQSACRRSKYTKLELSQQRRLCACVFVNASGDNCVTT